MISKRNMLFTCLVAGQFAGTPAVAQPGQSAVPTIDPKASTTPPAIPVNPLVTYIMTRDKIGKADAEERVAIQGDIVQVLSNPIFSADPNFAGISVQDRPVYKVFLTYFHNDNKSDLLKNIPPRLRRYVTIRKAKRNKEERATDVQVLRAALGSARVPFATAHDEVAEVIVVMTANEEQANRLKALVPAAMADRVEIRGRGLATAQQTSGAKAGYPARAGYGLQEGCTLGYPITYTLGGTTNRKGILTAGHCTNVPRTLKFTDGATTRFEAPTYKRDTGNYDYGIYDVTGMISDYNIWYRNNTTYTDPNSGTSYYNSVPQFPATGMLYTQNFIRGSAQWQGMNICKSGAYTGLTCARVNFTNYDWRRDGSSAYVYVDESSQENLSVGGDSGAPWFTWTNPSSSPYVSAVGIHVAGYGAGYGGIAVYMPIDRVFDTVTGGPSSVRLLTSP